MDLSFGPHIRGDEQRASFLRQLPAQAIWTVLNKIKQRETFLLENSPTSLDDCHTVDQAVQTILRPIVIEQLANIRSLLLTHGFPDMQYVWRRLWGGSLEALYTNVEHLWPIEDIQEEERLNVCTDLGDGPTPSASPTSWTEDTEGEWDVYPDDSEVLSPRSPPGPSGHGHDVHFMRLPDAFGILGSILDPKKFCSSSLARTLPHNQISQQRRLLLECTRSRRRRNSNIRPNRRRSAYQNQARGPQLSIHLRRRLTDRVARLAEQRRSRIMFLTAMIERAQAERRSRYRIFGNKMWSEERRT